MPLTVFAAQSSTSPTPTNDIELWGTDGTTGRTFLIKDIRVGPEGSFVGNNRLGVGGSLPFAVLGNNAYFLANDGSTGFELWRTDGTTAGTTRVTDFFTNNGTAGDATDDTHGYSPQNIVATSNAIYWVGPGPAAANPSTSPPRFGIWKYDPVTTGITFVSGDVGINNLMAVGDRIYWTFDHATQGFRSSTGLDGADAGTEPDVDAFAGGTGTLLTVGSLVYHINQTGSSARFVNGATVTEMTGEPINMQGMVSTSSHVYFFTATGLFRAPLTGTATEIATVSAVTATGLGFDFQNAGFGGHTPGFAAAGNKLIFSNNRTGSTGVGAGTGSEVWVSDGTGAGTFLLKDIVAGSGSSVPHNFITVGSQVFFQASNGNGSVDLWKTDGTVAGTVLVETLFRGSWSTGSNQVAPPPEIANMSVQNGVLFFSFDDAVNGTELWRSDGTAEGTLMIRNINSTPIDSSYQFFSSSIGAALGGTGLFVGWNAQTGYELFSTNGTAAGTALLKDLNLGGGNSAPQELTVAGSKAFFSAFDPATGRELYVSDGTANGTVLLKDIRPGLGSGSPSGLTAIGNKVYFTADDGVNGFEAWVSDGTASGTFMLKDNFPGSVSGFPNGGGGFGFTAAGTKVFFVAQNFSSGSGDPNAELYVTDGTTAGTARLEINNTGTGGRNGSNPSHLTEFGGKVYFFANNGLTGNELWSSDGTAGGTAIVADLKPGDVDGNPGPDGVNPNFLFVVNGKLVFYDISMSGAQFYVSSGTAASTAAHGGLFSGFGGNPVILGTKMIFSVSNFGPNGTGLYATDGTGAGPTFINPAGMSQANNITPVGSLAVFSAFDSTNGTELWRTDGTTTGTQLLKNINNVSNGMGGTNGSNPTNFVLAGNKVFFLANDGANGQELWVTDGTALGTVLVKNIGPTSANGASSILKAIGNSVLFMANDAAPTASQNSELWISDGTNAGTFRVTDVVQPGSSFFSGVSSFSVNSPFPSTFASVPFTLPAGATGETFIGTADPDYFDGLGGNDFLDGRGGDDVLIGGANDDILVGGEGHDLMKGGPGNDTFYVDSASDVVIETSGQGNDRVAAAVSYALPAAGSVETLEAVNLGSTDALNFTGNAFDQTIIGNNGSNILSGDDGIDTLIGAGGADFLVGGLGNDIMIGGLGDDNYYVDSLGDSISEAAGEGNDRVAAASSYVLAAGQSVETIEAINLTDTTPINLTGNAFNQFIAGNNGNNILTSGGGNDTMVGAGGDDVFIGSSSASAMQGGTGNDSYYVVDSADAVVEVSGEGNDRISAGTSYTLGAAAEVETIEATNLSATTALDFTGNAFQNLIIGNNGPNILDGKGGNDVLVGLGGADIFRFTTALSAATNVDRIDGFVAADDTIQLDGTIFTALSGGTLSANAFKIGTQATDVDDRIIYDPATGRLFYDADGDLAGAAVHFATLAGAPAISASDFVVI